MNNSIQIKQSVPLAGLLKEITEKVVEVAPMHDVYISVGNTAPETIFTLFVDTTFTRIDNDLLEPLNQVFEDYLSITYNVFSGDYAADAIRKGNLYFIEHCVLGQLAYTNTEAKTNFHPESEQPSILIPRAKKQFKRAMGKVDGKYTTFPKSLKNEKYVDAAYTLHQMMEQLFKIAEEFILGKQLFAKDISEHQTALTHYAPGIATLFDTKHEEDVRLLELLHSAYLAFRHKNHLDISRADIEKLLFKTQSLRRETERIFIEALARCYEKAGSHQTIPAKKDRLELEHTVNDEAGQESPPQPKLPKYMLTDTEGYVCNLKFSSYFDLFVVIEDLIEISLHTLYNADSENSGFVRNPHYHLVSVLELIKKLLPGDTGQTLTELNDYLNAVNDLNE
ncbi:hypothetical protein AM493_17100 [Flavobacterium akiainvivens]|uniref:Uncharacterized protein n=1 Tax=Flavobacterium akiainvivens TaxID=1202724 RepID=A0A0M9VJA4_9FLAO|nr:hypothetical protein [Flavobacterium akiainvivens]KOS07566.1 hypothetical protein AM493_17100 [Flavobacterium akiainvivens]SFQ77774.1 hypothetical protein SAMN05444144_1272 [Flavobacterium akiainvivens]